MGGRGGEEGWERAADRGPWLGLLFSSPPEKGPKRAERCMTGDIQCNKTKG
jgi:hypothetical protein